MANAEQYLYQQTQTIEKATLDQPWALAPESFDASYGEQLSVPDLISDAKRDLDNALKQQEYWMLPGTGFSMQAQMQRLFDSLESPLSCPEEFQTRVGQWIEETEIDIVTFNLEYLSDTCVYPIQLAQNNRGEIVCPQYGNVRYEDIVQDTERSGAVKDSSRHISAFLASAAPGSTAFFTSPPGWSGLATDQGAPITFPDTQTYLFRVRHDGSIEAATVQTDMTLSQNKKLLESAGQHFSEDFDRTPLQEQITDVVGRVVAFDTGAGLAEIPFEEIVRRMQKITGSEIASKGVSFGAIYHDLSKIDELMQVDSIRKQLIDTLKTDLRQITRAVLQGEATLSDFARKIGSTVLSLAAYAAHDQKQVGVAKEYPSDVFEGTQYGYIPSFTSVNSSSTLSFLQSKPGCNGGGGSIDLSGGRTTAVLSAGGFRIGQVGQSATENSEKWEWKPGTCRPYPGGCGRKNVDVGPCDLCRKCQRDYDAGRKQ